MRHQTRKREGESLRGYQERLQTLLEAARQPGVAQHGGVYVGFRSGRENYLVAGEHLMDVHLPTAMEPIPGAKPWAVGAANIKGSVYAITDFSLLNNGSASRRGKFLVIKPEVMAGAALVVDAITGLYTSALLEKAPQSEAPSDRPWLSRSYQFDSLYHLVDLKSLSTNERFSILQRGESQ